MTLPLSGPMSASMINVELGRASTAPFDINGSDERTLAQVPTGVIKFSDFYGKSHIPPPPLPLIRWRLYQNGILTGGIYLTPEAAASAWSYFGSGPWHPGLISNIPINVTIASGGQTALQSGFQITYNIQNSSNVIQTTPNSPNGVAPYWQNIVAGYTLHLQSAGNTTGGVLTMPVLICVLV